MTSKEWRKRGSVSHLIELKIPGAIERVTSSYASVTRASARLGAVEFVVSARPDYLVHMVRFLAQIKRKTH